LYSRECCANALYAIGVLHLRHGRNTDARTAFDRALQRVSRHPLARLGRAVTEKGVPPASGNTATTATTIEETFCIAATHVLGNSPALAAKVVEQALAAAPPSNAGWLLPVEPLLNVHAAPADWEPALARLSARAM
jgi:hypothetical protein